MLKVEQPATTESVIRFQAIVVDARSTRSYVHRANNQQKPLEFKNEEK